MTAPRKKKKPAGLELLNPERIRPIAAVATVAGVVLAVASRLQGPAAIGSLVLFCLGISVIDGLGKRRFSIRQAVIFLATIGAALLAWGLVALYLLQAVDLATSAGVQAVLIAGAACILAAVVVGFVSRVVERRTIKPPPARRGRGSAGKTGFEKGGTTKSKGPRRAGPAKSQPAAAGRGD
jgi:predicted membrane protein